MNDREIRQSFHRKVLARQRSSPNTLVLDELGLMHGTCRADIAVVNGRLIGYEIKSNADSLDRLKTQVPAYDAIFDRVSVVVGERHRASIVRTVPKHWGIIVAKRGGRGAVRFEFRRHARQNQNVKPYTIAQLLWRSEAVEIVSSLKAPPKLLKLPRRKLYRYLSRQVALGTLKRLVRRTLKKRKYWRHPSPPSSSGDSFQPTAKSSSCPVLQGAQRTC
jgi:hypothetical protein